MIHLFKKGYKIMYSIRKLLSLCEDIDHLEVSLRCGLTLAQTKQKSL